mmetsp:Transcript_81097/g.235267  ORF Transcript_81097/g.235267 Transcript_81097/m.235267 type:complete len:289 (+) Transcript_81097:1253-2119(+)
MAAREPRGRRPLLWRHGCRMTPHSGSVTSTSATSRRRGGAPPRASRTVSNTSTTAARATSAEDVGVASGGPCPRWPLCGSLPTPGKRCLGSRSPTRWCTTLRASCGRGVMALRVGRATSTMRSRSPQTKSPRKVVCSSSASQSISRRIAARHRSGESIAPLPLRWWSSSWLWPRRPRNSSSARCRRRRRRCRAPRRMGQPAMLEAARPRRRARLRRLRRHYGASGRPRFWRRRGRSAERGLVARSCCPLCRRTWTRSPRSQDLPLAEGNGGFRTSAWAFEASCMRCAQ